MRKEKELPRNLLTFSVCLRLADSLFLQVDKDQEKVVDILTPQTKVRLLLQTVHWFLFVFLSFL